jgi:hypothetical protein
MLIAIQTEVCSAGKKGTDTFFKGAAGFGEASMKKVSVPFFGIRT